MSSLALVTGASSGIGRAFARRLAADGRDLVLTARRVERLEELARELEATGVACEVLPADLSDPAELARLETRAGAGDIDLLVNDAGLLPYGSHAELDVDREEQALRVMAIAPLRLARAALPGMLQRGRGGIVNVSSRAAFGPEPRMATYAGVKAFVNSWSLGLAEELEESGVRVVAVCPGNTRTEIFGLAGFDVSDVPWAHEPEDVVAAALEGLARGSCVVVPGEGARDRWLRQVMTTGLGRKLARVVKRLAP